MSADLEPYQGGTPEPYERLTHDEMVKVGQALHQSGWFKDITDPGKAVVKIMLGQEMGVSPMTAVRGIFVIPSSRGPVITLSGDLVAKLMKAHGYNWTIDALDEQGCRLTIFSGPRKLGQVEFTQAMARKAGLLGKDGPWKQFTEDMFFNRAICRAQRRYAPEVTGGLPMPVVEAEELDASYPDPRDDLVKALHATYREHFPKPAGMDAMNYRIERLGWSTAILGRDVPSWNGPEAPETLTRADVQTLLDALESTPALTREQSAPMPRAASAAGADSTAPQSSAGDQVGSESISPGPARVAAPPAEHHTAEVYGEVAPADGTVPAGESRSDTGLPPGAAPSPTSDLLDALKVSVEAEKAKRAAPTRKRHKTDPGKGLSIPAAIAEKQRFMDDRKTQTEVEHPPADPIQAMPPTFRKLFLGHFGNEMEPALGVVNEHITEWTAAWKWPATGDAAPWSLELLQELAADTFDKDMYR